MKTGNIENGISAKEAAEIINSKSVANTLSNYPFTLESAKEYADLTRNILDFIIVKRPANFNFPLYLQGIRKENGILNMININAQGYTNSVGTDQVLFLGWDDKQYVDINGVKYIRMVEFANSGLEAYILIDEINVAEGSQYGTAMYFLDEVYNTEYPSLYKDLNIKDTYSKKDFIYSRLNESVLQNAFLKNNELYEYMTSDRGTITSLNAGVTATIEKIPYQQIMLPSETIENYPLPFKNMAKFTAVIPAINSQHHIRTATSRQGNFAVSFWFCRDINDGIENGNANREIRIKWRKGMNDREIKVISGGAVTAVIDPQIEANGYYQDEDADRIFRCNGTFTFGELKFYNYAIETKSAPDVFDYAEIMIGNFGAFAQNVTATIYYTGTELLDKLPVFTSATIKEHYQGESKLHSLAEQVRLETNSHKLDYTYTYDKHNKIIDLLDGATTFSWVFEGGSRYHLGQLWQYPGVSLEKIHHSKFGNGYRIYTEDGSLLPVYGDGGDYDKMLLRYIRENLGTTDNYRPETMVFGFWIERSSLHGNPLVFTSNSGGTWVLNPDDLATVGFVETRVQTDTEPWWKQTEVLAVEGDFSYIIVRSRTDVGGNEFNNIILTENSDLTELVIYNPTVLYDVDIIDPYYTYKSESQRNNSPLRGKTVMIMGDSQQNDNTIGLGIATQSGVNIVHAPLGGHRMKYQDNGIAPFSGWMYHWDARQRIFSVPVDYYFFMISSNDVNGGGDSSSEATKAVLDNYPAIGDTEAAIIRKLSLFNSLSDTEKEIIFDYKQTYSAFIKQAAEYNPNAKIILATIPVLSHDATDNGKWMDGRNADTERATYNPIFLAIRNDIYELSEKHSANICDLFTKGGITWENFPKKVDKTDSVHWNVKAKKQFINPVIQTLLE